MSRTPCRARTVRALAFNTTTSGTPRSPSPHSEAEQYYEALKLRRIDTAPVRIPDASHGMEGRPSHLVGKVVHILKWFETHKGR
ncbi:MAG: hypothetical protein IT581_03710 [Verrucomicrobiales bacterium]|nr:hypothetical protein [Verrucomicrobiales bacterium]